MKSTAFLLIGASCLVALLASCRTVPPSSPAPSVERAPVATPAVPAARDAALAEVKRLTEIADKDPMLAPWTGPYGGVPPWDKLNVAGFGKAFETGLALLLAEVDAISDNPDPPTFENTFVPLEDAGRHSDRAQTLFSILTNNLSTPEVQAVDKEWSPKIAAAYDKITFNTKLFSRVQTIYDGRASLNPEQRRLVELNYDRFVRAGAKLSPDDKAKVGKINEELAGLFSDFSKKVLADENTWTVLESKKDLAGLSPSGRDVQGGGRRAQPRGQVGGRQHAIERRPVPGVLVAPRSA